MAISRSAIYQRARRARDGIRAAETKQKLVDRILLGRVPWRQTLAKHGLSYSDVNKIRTDDGLQPIDFTLSPTRCRRGPRTCSRVSPAAVEPAVRGRAPQPAEVPPPSPAIVRSPPAPPAPQSPAPPAPQSPAPPGAPAAPGGGGLTLSRLLELIADLEGKPQLTAAGRPVLGGPQRQPRLLRETTVKQYKDGMRLLGGTTGCADAPDFVACLRDTAMVYIPAFEAALGAEALEVYRTGMIEAIRAAEAEAIAATETASVVPITGIKRKLKDIAERFGSTSQDALAARLQVELVGIRDDLGGVRVVKSEREAKRLKLDN
eukprot:jgi/Tetstr1/426453/TSEL_016754.t1